MALSKEDKEDIKAAAVLAVIILLLLWLWSISFGAALNPSIPANGGTTLGGDTIGGLGGSTYNIGSPYAPQGGEGDCCCGTGNNGCPASTDTLATVNQMIANAAASANQIIAAGNQTAWAIVNTANENDPLLQFTTG